MIVSKYPLINNIKDNQDIHIMDWLSDASYAKLLAPIRAEKDIEKAKQLKAETLPYITPSGTFSPSRSEANLKHHSGLISFDVDDITAKQTNSVKQIISSFPYTLCCGLSARGIGLWGLFKIQYTHKHKEHFAAMVRYFAYYGIPLDLAPSNVSSPRFYSYDPEMYLNEKSKVFNLVYEELKPRFTPKKIEGSGNSIADDFNQNCSQVIESLLLSQGWKYCGTKGTNIRYTRPGKSKGISANYCTERKLFFVWSSDPATGMKLGAARAYNNWQVYRDLMASGSDKEAANQLVKLGFGKQSINYKSTN